MTRPARFTQPDVTRAVNAVRKAGLPVKLARVLPDGSIEVLVGEPEAADNANWFAGSPLYKDVA